MNGRGPMGGGPAQELIKQFAPIFFGVLFILVAIALIRNWVDERAHPDEVRRYDAVRNFGRVNSASLARTLARAAREQESRDRER